MVGTRCCILGIMLSLLRGPEIGNPAEGDAMNCEPFTSALSDNRCPGPDIPIEFTHK
jgi:hypothetical protein